MSGTDDKYHVLLIGVDNYMGAPLRGCVNDIDAVQRVLLGERMKLSKDRIRRLASPLPRTRHEVAVPERPATLANIREALVRLGSDMVAPGDRVFIYYAGHGSRVEVATPEGRRLHREALVPADYDAEPDPQLLFDFELNAHLRAVLARTRSVTVVLDCCFGAGATREGASESSQLPRFLELDDPRHATRVRRSTSHDVQSASHDVDDDRGLARIDGCHVVVACMNYETAKEELVNSVSHGLLTRAFVGALEAAREPNLATLAWAPIWQPMQAYIVRHNPGQHPWMTGNARRAVFAGPPQDGDPGFPVRRSNDGYQIAGGTLGGITVGAVLAVYGVTPRIFPQLDSEEDHDARLGTIRVTATTDASATAVPEGSAFELPPSARGRLIRTGTAPRLPCAVLPPDSALERQLAASPRLELVDAARAAVKLERLGGRWFVTDTIHGVEPHERVLFALQSSELDCARVVLEHYYVYSRPLRMAALARDLPDSLELTVRSCPDREFPAADAQAVPLPEAPSHGEGTYTLRSGARVCFQVRNRSRQPLRVTLLNSASSGKVQLLGDQIIDAGTVYRFWARGTLGSPFQMSPPSGVLRCIDRLVAIGRTALDHSLDYLRVNRTFAQVILRSRGDREIDDGDEPDTTGLEHWTATQVVVETRDLGA
jgi:hypothetical protein